VEPTPGDSNCATVSDGWNLAALYQVMNCCPGKAQESSCLVRRSEGGWTLIVVFCLWLNHIPRLLQILSKLTRWIQVVIVDLKVTKNNPLDESRIVVDRWPRPLGVTLTGKSTTTLQQYLAEGDDGFGVKLTIQWPGATAKMVKPPARLLDQFTGLRSADDERIREFAEKFGGLGIFCRKELLQLQNSPDGPMNFLVTESCEVWRYFAGAVLALLKIAATLDNRKPGTAEDWEAIGNIPLVMREMPISDRFDFLSPVMAGGEKAWVDMAYFVERGPWDRNREMWLRLINSLLDIGRVRPIMMWRDDGERVKARPHLVYGTPALLSYIALKVALTSARTDAFAVCSYCGKEYTPIRAPKFGQRNFCNDCRKAGVVSKLAQQDRRARLRE
jgi:hypothetical protein